MECPSHFVSFDNSYRFFRRALRLYCACMAYHCPCEVHVRIVLCPIATHALFCVCHVVLESGHLQRNDPFSAICKRLSVRFQRQRAVFQKMFWFGRHIKRCSLTCSSGQLGNCATAESSKPSLNWTIEPRVLDTNVRCLSRIEMRAWCYAIITFEIGWPNHKRVCVVFPLVALASSPLTSKDHMDRHGWPKATGKKRVSENEYRFEWSYTNCWSSYNP